MRQRGLLGRNCCPEAGCPPDRTPWPFTEDFSDPVTGWTITPGGEYPFKLDRYEPTSASTRIQRGFGVPNAVTTLTAQIDMGHNGDQGVSNNSTVWWSVAGAVYQIRWLNPGRFGAQVEILRNAVQVGINAQPPTNPWVLKGTWTFSGNNLTQFDWDVDNGWWTGTDAFPQVVGDWCQLLDVDLDINNSVATNGTYMDTFVVS